MIFISLFTLFLSGLLFRKASGGLSIKRPNIIAIFFWAIIVFQFVGSFALINSYVPYNWWVSRASNPETGIFWAHLSILSILIITPITVISVFKIAGFNPNYEFPLLYTNKVKPINKSGDRQAFNWLMIATIIVFLALGYLIYSARTIPILEAIAGGDDLLLRSARIDSLGDSFLLRLINGIFGRWIAPILLFTIFGYYFLKKKRKYFLLFVLCAIAVFFIATFRTEKAPAVHLILMLVLVQAIYSGHVKVKVLAKFSILIFALLIIMYIHFMGAETIAFAVEAIFSRIFLSQHVGTVLAFDYFPDVEGFTGGKRILPFSSFLFGSEEVRSFALKMMEHYNPGAWEAGLVGYLSTSYVAEGYSYWGWLGIPLSSIIVGVFLSIISILSVRLNKHPVTVALTVFLMYKIPFMLNSGLNIAIYSTELVATLLFFSSIVFLLRGRLAIKFKSKYVLQ